MATDFKTGLKLMQLIQFASTLKPEVLDEINVNCVDIAQYLEPFSLRPMGEELRKRMFDEFGLDSEKALLAMAFRIGAYWGLKQVLEDELARVGHLIETIKTLVEEGPTPDCDCPACTRKREKVEEQ